MCLFEVNTLILDTISMRLKKNLNASDLQLLIEVIEVTTKCILITGKA